jgi:C4-type Zn-finger protein
VRLEGLRQLKNLVTSSATEPATFLLAAECHNQLRYRVLQSEKGDVRFEVFTAVEL